MTDTQTNIRRIAEIIAALDSVSSSANAISVFALKYADAKALVTVIKETFPAPASSRQITAAAASLAVFAAVVVATRLAAARRTVEMGAIAATGALRAITFPQSRTIEQFAHCQRTRSSDRNHRTTRKQSGPTDPGKLGGACVHTQECGSDGDGGIAERAFSRRNEFRRCEPPRRKIWFFWRVSPAAVRRF